MWSTMKFVKLFVDSSTFRPSSIVSVAFVCVSIYKYQSRSTKDESMSLTIQRIEQLPRCFLEAQVVALAVLDRIEDDWIRRAQVFLQFFNDAAVVISAIASAVAVYVTSSSTLRGVDRARFHFRNDPQACGCQRSDAGAFRAPLQVVPAALDDGLPKRAAKVHLCRLL
mmetsp:Transcript_2104/g.5205  ORF Transcript_2104/g.5205 Transcript_2104/m.5205 type:complete len:168 (+) Transcript_2104:42-545(+)